MTYLRPLELYQQSLKTTGPLMGLSVGKTYLGYSMSDNTKTDVPQRSKITLLNDRYRLSTLQSLIAKFSVSGLVVGYPFKREDRIPTAGLQAKRFLDELNKTRNFEDVNYTLWDETFTTKMAFHSLEETTKLLYESLPMIRDVIMDEHAAYEVLKEFLHIIINQSEDSKYFDIINRVKPF